MTLFASRAAETSEVKSPFRRAVDEVQAAAHRHPDRSAAYFVELEQGFRRLQKEYPQEAEVYAELLFVADHTEGTGAQQLAQQILDWPAPDPLKSKAKGVLWKKSAVGKVCDLSFTAVDGSTLKLAQYLGSVVLIDFWATWCGPCRQKLPELKSLYAKYHPRGFEVIGISFDEDLQSLKTFATKERISWKQVSDGKGWEGGVYAPQFGVTSLPTMWLIDKQGKLRDVDCRDDLAQKLAKLMAE